MLSGATASELFMAPTQFLGGFKIDVFSGKLLALRKPQYFAKIWRFSQTDNL